MPILEEDLKVGLKNDLYSKRIHFWNRIYRAALIVLVLVAIGIQISSNSQNKEVLLEVKKGQEQYQASTIEARKANAARQNQTNNLIDCLVLAKFDFPPDQFKTRKGSEEALKKCASKQ